MPKKFAWPPPTVITRTPTGPSKTSPWSTQSPTTPAAPRRPRRRHRAAGEDALPRRRRRREPKKSSRIEPRPPVPVPGLGLLGNEILNPQRNFLFVPQKLKALNPEESLIETFFTSPNICHFSLIVIETKDLKAHQHTLAVTHIFLRKLFANAEAWDRF